MHTCEVFMRHKYDTPDQDLIPCGSEAKKKMGFVWICDYHYDMFRVCIDAGDSENASRVFDSTPCSDDDWDTYFENEA